MCLVLSAKREVLSVDLVPVEALLNVWGVVAEGNLALTPPTVSALQMLEAQADLVDASIRFRSEARVDSHRGRHGLMSSSFLSLLQRLIELMSDLCEYAPLLDSMTESPAVPAQTGVDFVEPWLLGESGILAEALGDRNVSVELSDDELAASDLSEMFSDEGFAPWSELGREQLLERFFLYEFQESAPLLDSFVALAPPAPVIPVIDLTGDDSDDHPSEWSTEAVVVPRVD